MEGFVEMNRVPGFFYITTSDFTDILFNAEQKGYSADLSFKIAHFSFGKRRDFDSIKAHYPRTDVQHPLDGFAKNATFTKRNGERARPFQTSFFIEAVPSIFKSSFGSMFDTEVF